MENMAGASRIEKDVKILHNNNHNHRTNCGICCICRLPPVHSKNYYGLVFCTNCFYKYIFSQSKPDCSGDITKKGKNGKKESKRNAKEDTE